jgi:beta-N-acetylhexosaminidase
MHRRWALAVAAAIGLACLAPSASASAAAGATTHAPADVSAAAPASTAAAASAAAVRVIAGDEAALATRAAAVVAAMTPRQKAGAVVMGHLPSTDPAAVRAYMEQTGAGGFIVMGANVAGSESALRTLVQSASLDPALPPLVAVDQEGGDVRRLKWDDFPSSLTLKTAPPEATAEAYAGRGSLVERAGIDVNFGIVADYTADPGSFIYRRSLGTDASAAASRVAAAVTGEAPFVDSTLKHFPGHGAAPGDSHRTIPSTDTSLDAWRAGEALPFRAGIDAGAQLVMFGHLAYTSVDAAPASLSAAWHDILRNELGFTGVAITDDMAMLEASGVPAYRDPVANAVAALVAGNDMVLGVAYSSVDRANAVIDGIAAAAASGALSAKRLDEAATRVVALRLDSATGALPCDGC